MMFYSPNCFSQINSQVKNLQVSQKSSTFAAEFETIAIDLGNWVLDEDIQEPDIYTKIFIHNYILVVKHKSN